MALSIHQQQQEPSLPNLGRAKYDLATLRFLSSDYKPRKEPFCMVIGPGGEKEASAVRSFHLERFSMNPSSLYIAGVSIAGTSAARQIDHYEFLVGDPILGDLRFPRAWTESLFNSTSYISDFLFDLIWIRNPELQFQQYWFQILSTGADRLTKDGVFCMVIRRDDIEYVDAFLNLVSNDNKFELISNLRLEFADEEDNFGTHERFLVFKLKEGRAKHL